MTKFTSPNSSSCLLASLFIAALYVAALLGLLFGVLTLAEVMPPIGITTMIIFMFPLFVYLLIGGLRDRSREIGTRRWIKLVSSGAMLVVMAGSGIYQAIYMGTCDRRLEPGGKLSGCNFSGRDLSGLDLQGADLSFTNLSGANLTGTNLNGARFNDTDLSSAIGLSDETLALFLDVAVNDLPSATAKYAIHLENRMSLQKALAPVCAGQGVRGTHVNPDAGSFHTVMVLDPQGNPSSAWSDVPQSKRWEPMALRFTDLVACVGELEKVLLSSCSYSGGHSIGRFRYQVQVRLMDAATGRLVAEETLRGSEPGSCPSSTYGGQGAINGSKISDSDLAEWLAGWVHP